MKAKVLLFLLLFPCILFSQNYLFDPGNSYIQTDILDYDASADNNDPNGWLSGYLRLQAFNDNGNIKIKIFKVNADDNRIVRNATIRVYKDNSLVKTYDYTADCQTTEIVIDISDVLPGSGTSYYKVYYYQPAGYACNSNQYDPNSSWIWFDQFSITYVLHTYTISGYVKDEDGNGVSGGYIYANNGGGADYTNSYGYYSVEVEQGWSGSITPSKENCTFSPSNRNFNNVTANYSNVNFTATCTQPPSLELNPSSLDFESQGGTKYVDVYSNVDWTVTVSDDWISVSPTSGTGNDQLSVNVSANSSTSSRTGTVTVSGGGITRNISVYQEGMPEYFNLVVSNYSIAPNPLEYGRKAAIAVDVVNTGSIDFTGRVYLSWHKSTGEYITDLAYFDNLAAGQTKQLYFSTNHIISSPGDYKLVVKYTEDFSTYPVIQNYPVSVICPNIEASGLKIIGYLFDKSVIYEIPYNYFTHINVSFANPNSDYQVIIDGMTEEDLRNFVTYAKSQNSNIQIFLAIGGAAASTEGSNTYNYYSQIFSDQQIRQTFIQNLIDLINYCNLDGIDIDIEYKALELDGVNDFMIELINSIHDLNKKVSIAAEYSTWGDKINDDVICVADWINAMAYNAYNENTSYQFFIDNYNYWIQVRNLDKNKLVMGIPLFGRYFIQNDVKEVDFCSIISSLEDSFDGNTQYEVHNYPSTGTTTYWNGPQAILDKTAFARDNAGGVMFWEISQALCDDNQDIFQRVYNTMFLTTNIKNDRSSDLVIYPNPSRGEINIASDLEIDKIEIYNILGEKFKSISKPNGNKVYIPAPGIYLVKFYIGNKLILKKIIVN